MSQFAFIYLTFFIREPHTHTLVTTTADANIGRQQLANNVKNVFIHVSTGPIVYVARSLSVCSLGTEHGEKAREMFVQRLYF
jgi:hypothetical protein